MAGSAKSQRSIWQVILTFAVFSCRGDATRIANHASLRPISLVQPAGEGEVSKELADDSLASRYQGIFGHFSGKLKPHVSQDNLLQPHTSHHNGIVSHLRLTQEQRAVERAHMIALARGFHASTNEHLDSEDAELLVRLQSQAILGSQDDGAHTGLDRMGEVGLLSDLLGQGSHIRGFGEMVVDGRNRDLERTITKFLNKQPLNPKEEHTIDQFIYAVGGGTGARVGGTGNTALDREIIRRMTTQDLVVLAMLGILYCVTLLFGWSIVYRMAQNNSSVRYYSDRTHSQTSDQATVDSFLTAFNQSPKDISLQITGFNPSEFGVLWRGGAYTTSFCFSLDLTNWVRPSEPVGSGDRKQIQQFVTDTNALARADIEMEVSWADWNDLAVNIKHQFRQNGFTGPIDVQFCCTDKVRIYQNKAWANFMHSGTTKALCALSIIGGLFYVPYMWLRCSKTTVKTHFKVDMPIQEYWDLVRDKLTATGFDSWGSHAPSYDP